MISAIKDSIKSTISVIDAIYGDDLIIEQISTSVSIICQSYRAKGKVLFCGNGGSAADAQHFAAEFTGRFMFDRDPLPAEALHANTSYLTAVANDYSFDLIYSRLVKATGCIGDVLFAISTSGNSKNIINAIIQAKSQNMKVIGLTGITGGQMNEICDVCIKVPSNVTPRIQEGHIVIGHLICELVEKELF
ncbi:MAG: phosphoheptose isomerase [Candidatus Margulisbacteria bacterium GWF2_35_9]|nr:MAG: phosphoheptose isomerase [Candidatus Margulisbacteria bacterium GWF2_35_9]